MKTFKQYLTEAIEDTRGVLGRIDNLTNASEISKREFDELKYDFNRYIDQLSKPLKEKFLYGKGGELYKMDERLGDLAWGIPTSYIEIASLKSKLKKAAGLDHPIVTELQEFYDQYIGHVEKFKALKDKIVLASAKREEKKVAKEVAHKKKFTDSASLVNELMKDIEEYEKRAFDMAGEQYDKIIKPLDTAGGDLNKVAPYPDSRMGKESYRQALNYRNLLQSLTEPKAGDSNIRVSKPKLKTKYQENYKKAAHDSFIAWIEKMIDKIGSPVVKAESKGDPWRGSTLKVTTKEGEEQTWETQMIINRSKYNELFNQFPSRRKK